MKTVTLDCRGMNCPIPTLKMTSAVMAKEVVAGDTLQVVADCPTFEDDVKSWCTTMKKVLLVMRDEPPNAKKCDIRI
jgi:tRNA 2-thiouridine synthesizing protein A